MSGELPRSVVGEMYYEITELQVAEWHPTPDGSGPAQQVHIRITVRGFESPLIMRVKTPQTLKAIIAALQRHLHSVWPHA